MENLKATKALGAMRNLAYCMEKAIHNGFTANFNVMDGLLHHADSGKSYQPEQVHVVDFFRFEGVSDPDDNDILYLIRTNDGRRGTLADAYGIYASPDVGEFFIDVEDFKKKKALAD